MANKVYHVGSHQVEIYDKLNGHSFPVLIQYPTNSMGAETLFGPYLMNVCINAKPAEGKFPLIVISHGNGGSHLLYRTISIYLAQHGFVVAMLEHYGNNRNDNRLSETTENLQLRPLHISLTIDYILSAGFIKPVINEGSIAVIGHSMGGYAALALAGGIPRTKQGLEIQVHRDDRVKTIVLMAPGAGWFKYGLSDLKIPVLVLAAEHDTVIPSHVTDIVMEHVADKTKVTHKMIKNAGHFSFLSPFPSNMKSDKFLPSTDPAGFDRHQFHDKLPAIIFDFLKLNLN